MAAARLYPAGPDTDGAGGFDGRAVGSWLGLQRHSGQSHADPRWGSLDRSNWNGPSWSISTEVFAYALFALLACRLDGRRLYLACTAVLGVSLVLVVAFAPSGMASTDDFSLARCLYGFMAGAIANLLWNETRWRPRGELICLGASVAAVLWLPMAWSPLIVPVFAWTVLVYARDAGPVSNVLKRPFPQLLGRISYSIYMVHYVVGLWVMTAFLFLTPLVQEVGGTATLVAPWWVTEPVTLAYLAAVVLIARLTYTFIEKPGQDFFSGRTERIKAAW